MTQNFQALAGESLAPISPDKNSQKEDDLNNQDPNLQLTKTLQNADLSETVEHIHKKRRIVQLNSSDDELDQNYSTKFTPTRSELELECMRLDRKPGTPLRVCFNVNLPDNGRGAPSSGPLATHVAPASSQDQTVH